MALSVQAQKILAAYNAYKPSIVDRNNPEKLKQQLAAEEDKAILVLANSALTQRDKEQFVQQFPDYKALVQPELSYEDAKMAATIRAQMQKSSVDAVTQVQNNIQQQVESKTLNSIDAQQQGFIAKQYDEIFRSALSRGDFQVLTNEDESRIAFIKTRLEELDKIIEEVAIPYDEKINDFKAKDQADREYINKLAQEPNANIRAVNAKANQILHRWDDAIAEWTRRKGLAIAKYANEKQNLEFELSQLQNKQFTYDKIEGLRQKIINDIESFADDTSIDRTEELTLRDLINQGSIFITDVLGNNVNLGQDKIQELQLAILDATDFLKRKATDEATQATHEINYSLDGAVSNAYNPEITVDNPINDFFSGVGNAFTDFGTELAKVFNPPQDDMVDIMVKASRAQKQAAIILENEG